MGIMMIGSKLCLVAPIMNTCGRVRNQGDGVDCFILASLLSFDDDGITPARAQGDREDYDYQRHPDFSSHAHDCRRNPVCAQGAYSINPA
eukprot:8833363-Lingulodinium_polyedra.AAC.1